MQDYRKLKIWQLAHKIVLEIYKITRFFPKEECYALTNQMRRAAVSVPSNISEKCKKTGEEKTILFNCSGHGHFDMAAYQSFLSGDLEDYEYPEENIRKALSELPNITFGQ